MRALRLLLVLLWPGAGLAEPITVRSGEHADFSRLVIYFGDSTGWRFAPVEGGFALQPENSGITYDLDRIYQLIPRDRIAEVTARPDGSLFLSVDCPCHAQVSEHLGQVVVDVRDGAGTDPSAVRLAGEPTGGGQQRRGETGDVETLLAGLPPPYRPQGSRLAYGDLELSVPLTVRPQAPNMAVVPSGDPSVAEARKALIAQIARAASDGLVTPDLAVSETEVTDRQAAGSDIADPAPPAMPNPPEPAGPNFRIETAIERSELAIGHTSPTNERGATCLPSDLFDLAAWGKPPDKGSAIAQYRAGLVGEFDAADPQSLSALARHYIYLTFGAEAKSLIRSFDGQIENAALLTMLAEIMDNGRSSAMPEIAAQISCDSPVALWAVLASPTLSRSSEVSPTAVLAAFSSLPLHLRRHLGPGLAERFLQIGDTATAATLRNSIIRAPGKLGADVQMMEAEIELSLGDHAAAVDRLTEVVEEDGPLAPEAVITLIEARLREGEDPGPSMIETANTLAFEARGSEAGAQLKLVSLRAGLHRGAFITTFKELERAVDPYALPAAQVDALKREALELALRDGTDAQFLQVVLRAPVRLGPGAQAQPLRRAVAARLIDLGFANEARGVLGESVDVPSPEDRLLYARSFIEQDRPDLAIGYLAGLKDASASELRAKAHELAQEFDRAEALYSELGQTESSARAAWHGQMLDTVARIGPETQAAAAKLRSEIPADNDGSNAITLAESERVLEQSQTARAVLTALLTQTSPP